MMARIIVFVALMLLATSASVAQGTHQAQAQVPIPRSECPDGTQYIGHAPDGLPLCASVEVVNPSAPAEDEESRTGVYLTWAQGSNPNYVKQVVKRREVGVRPAQWTTSDVAASASEYTDTSVHTGKVYAYRVQAVRGNNQNKISKSIRVTVP